MYGTLYDFENNYLYIPLSLLILSFIYLNINLIDKFQINTNMTDKEIVFIVWCSAIFCIALYYFVKCLRNLKTRVVEEKVNLKTFIDIL